jgi:hypothetical protein
MISVNAISTLSRFISRTAAEGCGGVTSGTKDEATIPARATIKTPAVSENADVARSTNVSDAWVARVLSTVIRSTSVGVRAIESAVPSADRVAVPPDRVTVDAAAGTDVPVSEMAEKPTIKLTGSENVKCATLLSMSRVKLVTVGAPVSGLTTAPARAAEKGIAVTLTPDRS